MAVECLECGKRFTTTSMLPECPRCGEIALDAGRPEEKIHGMLRRAKAAGNADDAAMLENLLTKISCGYDRPDNITYELLIAAVKPAFPFARYGK